MFEGFHGFGSSFDESLNPAVRKVLNITDNLVASGGALGEKPIAYSLHLAANGKLSRNSYHAQNQKPSNNFLN